MRTIDTQHQLKDRLQSKVEEIANILNNSVVDDNYLGVLAGVSGKALFMFYYSLYTGNSKYADIGEQALTRALEIINNNYPYHNYCNGISGFAWTCEHLAQQGFIESKDITFLDELKPYLFSSMEYDFAKGNYDFLYGGLGVGFYFMTHKDNHKEINRLLECLEQTSEKMPDGCWKWKSILDSKSQRIGYNISLSHGMSSIVACMSKLYRQNSELSKAKEILSGAVKYIILQQIPQLQVSYFPNYSLENEDPIRAQSRLAWCYGDLGISQALLQASIALDDAQLQHLAAEVLHFSCARKELKTSFVTDAGLCHGTSGIAQIFQRAYYATNDLIFYDTANYWLEKTLEMAKFDDGLAGFKKWAGNDKQWIACDSLLEGITGIGLCILSALDNKLLPWDECLLLS
jgi:lantibiotic modifying enzyme